MIKIIGAILLVGGASLMGIFASEGIRARARSLAGFEQVLGMMAREIGEYLSPLPELMRRIAEITSPPLSDFFRACSEETMKRNDMPFSLIWSKNLTRAPSLYLAPQEREELLALGNVLGRYSAEEQKKSIEHAARRISALRGEAEGEVRRLAKLYAKLGVTCGIAVVIVFM